MKYVYNLIFTKHAVNTDNFSFNSDTPVKAKHIFV